MPRQSCAGSCFYDVTGAKIRIADARPRTSSGQPVFLRDALAARHGGVNLRDLGPGRVELVLASGARVEVDVQHAFGTQGRRGRNRATTRPTPEAHAVSLLRDARPEEGALARARKLPESQRSRADRALLQVASTFEHSAAGLTARTTEVVHLGGGGHLRVEGAITDETGRVVGSFRRTLIPPHEGALDLDGWGVSRGSTKLVGEVQGRGFGSALTSACEEAWAAAGISYVTFSATAVGSYAWAREGYEWEPGQRPGDPEVIEGEVGPRDQLVAYIEDHGDEDGSLTAMLARIDDLESETYPTPAEIAQLGRTEGAASWPGREIMLESIWSGFRRLTPE